MKLKYTLISATALCLAAGSADAAKTGAYAGIQAGINHQKTDFSNSIANGTGTPNNNTVNNSDKNNGFIGGIHLGFKKCLTQKMFAGLEVEVSALTGETKKNTALNTVENNTTKLKAKYSVIPKVLFGTHLTGKTDLFAILGADFTKFEASLFEDTSDTTTKKKFTKVRFMPGVGVSHALTNSLSMKAEARYHLKNNGKTLAANTGNLVHAAKYQQNAVSVIIGASYHF